MSEARIALDRNVDEHPLVCAHRVHPPIEDTSRPEAAREALRTLQPSRAAPPHSVSCHPC
jgi:hypothetical protein